MTLTQDFDEEEVEGLKVKILAALASLDRGLAANVSGQGHQPQQLRCQDGNGWVAERHLLQPQQGHSHVAAAVGTHSCMVRSHSTAAGPSSAQETNSSAFCHLSVVFLPPA
jgi:hypothetical protein